MQQKDKSPFLRCLSPCLLISRRATPSLSVGQAFWNAYRKLVFISGKVRVQARLQLFFKAGGVVFIASDGSGNSTSDLANP